MTTETPTDTSVLSAMIDKAGTANAVIRKIRKEQALTKEGIRHLQVAAKHLQAAMEMANRRTEQGRAVHLLFKKSVNRMRSLETAAADREVTLSQYQDSRKLLLADLEDGMAMIDAQMDEAMGPARKPKVLASNGKPDDLDQELTKLLRHANTVKAVPSSKSNKFHVMRLPVIPIFDPGIYIETLQAVGFDVDKIGFYPVLNDQLIVAVSTDYEGKVNSKSDAPVLKIRKGMRVIVSETKANKEFWFGTVLKTTTTKATIDFDSGDQGEYPKTQIVALLDDSSVKSRQKEGISKPLVREKLSVYALDDGEDSPSTTLYNPEATADLLIAEVREKMPNLNVLPDSPFCRNSTLSGYRLYWLADMRIMERLMNKANMHISEWNLGIGTWKDGLSTKRVQEYEDHEKNVKENNELVKQQRKFELEERMKALKNARRR